MCLGTDSDPVLDSVKEGGEKWLEAKGATSVRFDWPVTQDLKGQRLVQEGWNNKKKLSCEKVAWELTKLFPKGCVLMQGNHGKELTRFPRSLHFCSGRQIRTAVKLCPKAVCLFRTNCRESRHGGRTSFLQVQTRLHAKQTGCTQSNGSAAPEATETHERMTH